MVAKHGNYVPPRYMHTSQITDHRSVITIELWCHQLHHTDQPNKSQTSSYHNHKTMCHQDTCTHHR